MYFNLETSVRYVVLFLNSHYQSKGPEGGETGRTRHILTPKLVKYLSLVRA